MLRGLLRFLCSGAIAVLAAGVLAGTPSRAASQAAANPCDRACLDGFVDQYLTALAARDSSKLAGGEQRAVH